MTCLRHGLSRALIQTRYLSMLAHLWLFVNCGTRLWILVEVTPPSFPPVRIILRCSAVQLPDISPCWISAAKVGSGLEGIVACVVDPQAQVPGFRYFRGGHPTSNAESARAGEAILRTLEALDERSLALHMISCGGSAIVEKPISDTISLDALIVTRAHRSWRSTPCASIFRPPRADGWRGQRRQRSRSQSSSLMSPTTRRTRWLLGP